MHFTVDTIMWHCPFNCTGRHPREEGEGGEQHEGGPAQGQPEGRTRRRRRHGPGGMLNTSQERRRRRQYSAVDNDVKVAELGIYCTVDAPNSRHQIRQK